MITVPLMILAGLSVLGGALNLPGVGTFTHWLEHTFEAYHLHLHHGEFDFAVAISSTVLALVAIGFSWLLYGRNPLKKGQADPLKRILGPVYKVWENKYWVDEADWAVLLTPYTKTAQFLADVIDWRFWHDWFHDTVIAGTYQWLSKVALDRWADQRGIDGFANGLGEGVRSLANSLRRLQTGFVRNYALSVFIGVVVILGYLIIK